MSLTPSGTNELGTPAPDFQLPDLQGKVVSLSDYSEQEALLVVFMCNHCPYVKHIRQGLASFAIRNISPRFAMVGINSNDAQAYPADSPENMAKEADVAGYTFPYLYDETQSVAKAYQATCTPDFFLYDKNRRLIYRGQFDASRPGNDVPVTGDHLQAALDAVLRGDPPIPNQLPSVGCSIKWKAQSAE